uniref:Solute-binding protein family 3/N-terminal domain-containing protein n=1 Tax=Panagrolaimus sp. PS1159 TaxID=55785 RepID=A0AC35F9Y4_9BILA
MIADYLDIIIEPVVGQTRDYGGGVGNLINGTWHGLLGAVYNESVDVVASAYQYTKDRYKDFAFSYPIFNVKVVYITRTKQRTVESYLWNMFEPYETATWIAFFGSLLIQIIYGTLIRKFEFQMGLIKEFGILEKFSQYCRVQINQGNESKPYASNTGLIAFGVFALLQATMFSYLYQASLLASLLQPADLAPFKTAEEMVKLVRNGRFKLLATRDNYKSSWYFTDLQKSNEEHFRTLREAITHNPIELTDSIASALNLISTGSYVYPAQQDAASIILMRQKCNLYVFSKNLPEKSAYHLFNKNSTLLNRWNYGILMNQAFIRRTFQKYFESNFLLGDVAQCPKTKDDIPESKKPLDLISVFGVLMLFCIGIFGSAISFLIELWIFRKAQFYWNKNQSNVISKLRSTLKTKYIHNEAIFNITNSTQNETIQNLANEENVTFRQTWPL